MEIRELFSEVEAFVQKAKNEAMTKPGINSSGYTYLMGASSTYRDLELLGFCSVYFGEDYFIINISRSGVVYFKADISGGVVGFDSRSALSYAEHKDVIHGIWERAISRTTLSLYEQELERLISQRESLTLEIKDLDKKIGEHKEKMHQATNGGN